MANHTHADDHTVPMDLFRHLHANPSALAVFTALSTSDKRAYVAFVEEVNDQKTRKERIDEIILRLMLASA
ncbi:MAG: YdeI/OmpD-associated family protein [Chloroflexota bacterium]